MMNHPQKDSDFPAVFVWFFLAVVTTTIVIIGPAYSWELIKIVAGETIVEMIDWVIFWV